MSAIRDDFERLHRLWHSPSNVSIPYVIEKSGREEKVYDLFSRLLKDRIIFIGTPIDHTVANIVVGQLLFLQMENRTQDIQIFINSPGGSINAGLAIYDTMHHIECEIATYCVGMAASMASVILAAGAKGKRHALPNARIMIHQPWGSFEGTAADISIHAKEILYYRARLNQILSEKTGQPVERVEKDTERDFFMSADEAKTYGLVDEVLPAAKKSQGPAAK